MKIVFIIPGSGDSFYCGNCFRDNLQASALRKAGHDVTIMPLYLPLKQEMYRTDSPLFFHATSYYMAQKFFLNRRMPQWLNRILNSDCLLNLASSMSGTTSAEGMETMTLSMIFGEDKPFIKEVERLIDWLTFHEKPDIIHLSSTLLIGIARTIKSRLNIPIICSVQDEEVWIDSMKKSFSDIAWKGIANNLQYVDELITTSEFYKNFIETKIPGIKKPKVIYPGINHEVYTPGAPLKNPVIGFFYRMNSENGLDTLAEAFVKLKRKNTIPNLKLKIGGGSTSKDKKFIRKVKQLLKPYSTDVEFLPDYSTSEHVSFYQSISVISVPIRFNEGVGLYICEAFACGIPAVEPATGSFPEIVGQAGVLYHPNKSNHLAEALESILTNENAYTKAVDMAKQTAKVRYNDTVMADKILTIYKSYIKPIQDDSKK